MEQNTEYPFGFGFELMKHPDAMARFEVMNEDERREAVRRLSEIENHEEMRNFLLALGQGGEISRSQKTNRQKKRT